MIYDSYLIKKHRKSDSGHALAESLSLLFGWGCGFTCHWTLAHCPCMSITCIPFCYYGGDFWSCWTEVIRLIMGRHEESLVLDLITQIILSFGWDGSISEKTLAYAYDVLYFEAT